MIKAIVLYVSVSLSALLTSTYSYNLPDQHEDISPFVGSWHYSTNTYEMNLEVFEIGDTFKAYASVIAMNGEHTDTGNKESPNIEIIRFNPKTQLLSIKITSTYSGAVFEATLRKVDSSHVEFTLGEKIQKGIHFFPRKPTALSRR